MSLADFRKQHPEYNDVPDHQLADALYRKHYADVPRAEFDKRMGLSSVKAPAKGRGSEADPYRVGTRYKLGSPEYKREVAKIPVGAYYSDPQGNLRQKENASGGNPVRKRNVERVGKAEREATGTLANLNRGLLIGDEGSALLGTVGNVLMGKVGPTTSNPLSIVNGLGNSFNNELAKQRSYEDDFDKRRPWAGAAAQTTGMVPTLFVPGGAPAQAATRGEAVANAAGSAALQAGAAGLLDRGTYQERAKQGTVNALIAAPLGAAAGAIATRTPKANPLAGESPQQVLRDAGVSLTPGQRMGGFGKNVEDLAVRAPILGPAISGARERGVQSLQRSFALNALRPIGAKLPRDVKPGYDVVRYVDEALGNVYDDAFDMVPSVRVDQTLVDDITRIAQRQSDLPESMGATFNNIIKDRLARLQNEGLSGADVKQIGSELSGLAAEYRAKGEGTMADMLGDTRQALGGLIGRHNPDAAALIAKADEGWGIYKLLNSAASKADARGGVPTPGQYSVAVRSGAKRQGVNMGGKGLGQMQGLSSAAQQVMPDGFGNPGTANALGMGALGMGVVTEPTTGLATAAGLGAAATPYFLMGRKILEELPVNASADDLASAQQRLSELASRDPQVRELQRQLAARLGRATGAGIASANQRPSVATATQ